jgi:DNA-binding winged helix-turn-helix (wHTH) protein
MTLLKEIANDSLAENAKLKAKIERLRAALKPFAEEGARIESGPPGVTVHPRGFRVDELRAASSAFEQNAHPESCEHGNPKGACTVCHMREQAQKVV